MSALLSIANVNVGKGSLVAWTPIITARHTRTLYVESKLYKAIDSGKDYRLTELADDFDKFCGGGYLAIGYNDDDCFLKQMRELKDEVWEMRCKDPRPQVRVFGRFIATDTLVVTNYDYRDGINFNAQKRNCKATWQGLFPGLKPHQGSELAAYVSSDCYEVSERPER